MSRKLPGGRISGVVMTAAGPNASVTFEPRPMTEPTPDTVTFDGRVVNRDREIARVIHDAWLNGYRAGRAHAEPGLPFGCLGPECHLIDLATGEHVGSHDDDSIVPTEPTPVTPESELTGDGLRARIAAAINDADAYWIDGHLRRDVSAEDLAAVALAALPNREAAPREGLGAIVDRCRQHIAGLGADLSTIKAREVTSSQRDDAADRAYEHLRGIDSILTDALGR